MDQLSNAIDRVKKRCEVPSQQPYYLDFESGNCNYDRHGKKFETTRDIHKSQSQISNGMLHKITDYTQKYPPCKPGTQPEQLIKVDPINSVSKLASYNSQGDNPHSFWGVNNSNTRSVQNMSPEYLAMKQAQERTQLEENAHNYGGLPEEIKMKHAMERQMFLEKSSNNLQGGAVDGLSTRTEYANIGNYTPESQTSCLNAQGQWVTSNPQNYLTQNKYAHLKGMSPEMMNQIQGKPVAGDVTPPQQNCSNNGDVFEQTSFIIGGTVPCRLQQLKRTNEQSQKRILQENAPLQSGNFDTLKSGNNIGYSDFTQN